MNSKTPGKSKLTSAPEMPRSVAAIAAQHLEAEIIEGRLEPGERLIEEVWAKEFGISRGSFREVLHILEAAKLVEILPRRGAHVARLNRKDVEEIYLLRKHLLALGFSLSGANMTDEKLKELHDVFKKMERAVKKADVLTFCRCSQIFDDIVLEVSNIARLGLVIDFLGKQTLRYRHIGFRLPGRIGQSLEAHRQILEAFKKRDGRAAGEKVYEIIEKAGDSIVAHLFDASSESLEANSADKAAYTQHPGALR